MIDIKRSRLLMAALLVIPLMLAGCGDDGAQGPAGADGADGADGQDAIVLADIVALNPVLDLSNTVSYDAATETLTVHFFLTDGNGNGVDVFSDAYEFRFYVSELVDNNDGTIGQSWNGIINREDGTPAAGSPTDGTLTLVDAATGEYTYVFANPVPATDNVIRVTVRARWRETIGGVRYTFANPVNASYDFYQADPATELASSGADMVATEACETCHGTRIGNVGHGGGYTEVRTCNNCHNVNYMTSRNGGEGDLAFMVHRIHAAGSFDQLEGGIDFSEVTYPQEIHTCSKCHTADAPNANLSEMVPTRTNCGSCHDNVNFATGENHDGGSWDNDGSCNTCHRPGVVLLGKDLDPAHVHNPDPEPENVSEFDVTISMTPPANGTHYVAGETPFVLVKLAVDGVPVPGSVYTADADGEGVAGNLGEGLHVANLFVYGPRSNAVPVLTTNSTTDGGIQQGHSLLLTGGLSTDPQVKTDALGYRYQLMDNIGDLVPGTYMVRFEGEDYGALSDDDYQTASSAVITFQVGTAEEEHKVAGDACTNCHGATIMHLEGAHPHHQPFDTDGCLGCHDLSGNYADYIGNRVHAVHSASVTGDLKNRNWSEVTFPRPANNCTTCHTNPAFVTDPPTETPVWRSPDEVVCGGCHGAMPDAVPADYPVALQDQVLREVAAAQHMQEMGGDFDPTTPAQLQCLVCHGDGRIADAFVTHGLVEFLITDSEN